MVQHNAGEYQRGKNTEMRRTLLLDEDDLIMVVKEDIVKQIDQHRGEMNRTEFVNYLIQCQLKEQLNQKKSVSREEFQNYTRQLTDLLHSFLQFFVSYGMTMGKGQQDAEVQALNKQLESFLAPDEENEEL
jgi:hypothetical protein